LVEAVGVRGLNVGIDNRLCRMGSAQCRDRQQHRDNAEINAGISAKARVFGGGMRLVFFSVDLFGDLGRFHRLFRRQTRNAALYARTASAKPMIRASAVNSWPIEASAAPGNAATSGGKLCRLRSCPMLTTSPNSAARSAAAAQARSNAAWFPWRK